LFIHERMLVAEIIKQAHAKGGWSFKSKCFLTSFLSCSSFTMMVISSLICSVWNFEA
jgi:hypothetical protein